tara:strand:+ start:4223 stop:4996 length:774 start_codon:yes stop_codon:yes gene_type:complete
MSNQMKLIMESWRKNTLSENVEKSDGGEVLTGKELDFVAKEISSTLPSVFEKIEKQLVNNIKQNRPKIQKMIQQKRNKELNEIALASIWTAMQAGALFVSLAQLVGKISVSIAKKFGYGPTDPNSEYFNDFHKKVDEIAEIVKRSLQSFGMYAIFKKVVYEYNGCPGLGDAACELAEKTMNKISLFQDLIMIIVSFASIYGNWDKITTAAKNNEIMKAVGTAVNSTTSLETFAQIVEQTNGLKDFFKNAWGLATGTA